MMLKFFINTNNKVGPLSCLPLHWFREISTVFNVSNTVSGFRVSAADELDPTDFDPTGESYQTVSLSALLARNPYLQAMGYGRGLGGADAAPTLPFGSSPPVGRLQAPSGDDTAEELCRLVGRAGPNCLYQCPNGEWRYKPLFPYGMCPPFWIRGKGDYPWGDPPSPK
jgi:hypothetical protein